MNYEWNDILIIGDSYCRDRDSQTDWPVVVTNLLTETIGTIPPRGIGAGGCAWWYVRKILLKELALSIPKVLILCHTSYERIPNDYNLGLNAGILSGYNMATTPDTMPNISLSSIKDASIQYYTYLYSQAFWEWAAHAWYKELEQLLIQYKIPCVIHLNCFSPYIFNYGTTAAEILLNFSNPDTDNQIHHNHFLEDRNVIFGNNLYKAILEYNENDRLKNLQLFREF